jgi:hypothetical protein
MFHVKHFKKNSKCGRLLDPGAAAARPMFHVKQF